MFVSFFPSPKPFFWSVLGWTLVCILGWYAGGRDLGALFGMGPLGPDEEAIIGVSLFWSPAFLWFYLYFAVAVGLFAAFWMVFRPHPWSAWSILGSALIIFVTYFQVQVSLAINAWYGPFYDLLQNIMSQTVQVTAMDLYLQIGTFLGIALVAVTVSVLTAFFVSHYIFRWRQAMNDYYMQFWPRVRRIEGASQRVQEDTMRFSQIMNGLGINLIDSVMTLIAFLPLLVTLSASITALPIIGEVPYPLVLAAIFWSIFGTVLLAGVGYKLPGLEFRNQRVEAAYRKELVYGEDDETRAQPPKIAELFGDVRSNYFRLYFHYVYFNVVRYLYLQTNNIFALVLMAPSIAAGMITLGAFQRIISAFNQVTSSFQYLVNSWGTIIELLSVYKRLKAFEAAIHDEALPGIDQRYIERRDAGETAEVVPAG